MNGICEFTGGTNSLVCKKSDYTKEEFIKAIKEEFDYIFQTKEDFESIDVKNVIEGLCRFYPKGTEDSGHDWGEGQPVYQITDNQTRGTFEIWIYEH